MVRLILLVDWDPIGIFGYNGAMDEYDNYAEHIVELLESSVGEMSLIEYLTEIETGHMGLNSRRARKNRYNRIVGVTNQLLLLHSVRRQAEERRREYEEEENR